MDSLERYKGSPPLGGGVRGGAVALIAMMLFAFGAGMLVVRSQSHDDTPTYSSGMYGKEFFDAAYDRAQATPLLPEEGSGVVGGEITSALVAHHLLVADKIAEVFDVIGSDDVRTIVIVSPNHFRRGIASVQVSEGSWVTPYGNVESDTDAIEKLLTASPFLHHEEAAYTDEHGIFGLTPFVARSFPRAKVVSIVLREDVSADDAWQLGETIAHTLPDAVLIASVDMTHYRDAAYTQANDAKVMEIIGAGGMGDGGMVNTEPLDIDSNASLRVLFGFNAAHGSQTWHMTHHGSSLAMGATTDWHENTSHILGYFTSQ